jgi:hypothetical protein
MFEGHIFTEPIETINIYALLIYLCINIVSYGLVKLLEVLNDA